MLKVRKHAPGILFGLASLFGNLSCGCESLGKQRLSNRTARLPSPSNTLTSDSSALPQVVGPSVTSTPGLTPSPSSTTLANQSPNPTPTSPGIEDGANDPFPSGVTRYFSGDEIDVAPRTTSSLILIGGGEEPAGLLTSFVNRAGRGDIVVLRASGADGYNADFISAGANSVESLVFSDRASADSPRILYSIRHAEGIFLAGGDQSNYINYWRGTGVQRELNAAVQRGAVIAGTSAGLAVMSEYVFTAMTGSVTSNEALADPFNSFVTLGRDFLRFPHLNGVIADTHFRTRDRMGRLVTFMGRILADGWATSVRAIAVDESAAFVMEASGRGTVFGKADGHVYFVNTTSPPQSCKAGVPLTMRDLNVISVAAGSTFDLNTWSATSGIRYTLNAENGVLTSSNGLIYGN